MITIDKTDELYRYLTALQVENVDKEYLMLAENGRYKPQDVREYFASFFAPSQVEDVDEADLEPILDYYGDLKKVKSLTDAQLNKLLQNYVDTQSGDVKNEIIASQLKDVLYLCINYHTLHKDKNLQDLVQLANIGLMIAIDKYQPKKKVPFKDYLIYYARQEITKEFEERK